MADYTPLYTGGVKPFTRTTSGAVTAGRVLAVSGSDTVAHAGADSTGVVGVAAFDAASGAQVTIWPIDGAVHVLAASGAVTQGAGVVTDTAGQVKTATIATAAAAGTLIGTAAATVGSAGSLRVNGRH